jgi:hypothetical protein
MNTQLTLEPQGLPYNVYQELVRYTKEVNADSLAEYLAEARAHLEEARELAPQKPTINLGLAEAIFLTFERLQESWEALPSHARLWLCAAMRYFSETDDSDEHDFDSFVGFEDDAEVLNACLALAGKTELSINPAEYD